MTITVMICTWNRAQYLDQALTRMCNLLIPKGIEWELLIINNNSSDDTDQVIARHSQALPIRRMFEAKAGKSFAANLGLQNAKGDLIICTDDDVLVCPTWLSEYITAAREWPEASFFGGTIDPWFEVEPPGWIKKYLTTRGPYSVLQHGAEVRPLSPTESGPFGANMAIRASVFKEFQFNTGLGPIERQILPADDGEFIARLKHAGHWGVWVGPARVEHHIAKELLTSRYIWDWYREQGRSLVIRETPSRVRCVHGIPLWAVRQYCTLWVNSCLLFPFKSEQWVKAYTEAARTLGIIQQSRMSYAQFAHRHDSTPNSASVPTRQDQQ
jgi:glycosyltransferase involved in cell wall biosynthesis